MKIKRWILQEFREAGYEVNSAVYDTEEDARNDMKAFFNEYNEYEHEVDPYIDNTDAITTDVEGMQVKFSIRPVEIDLVFSERFTAYMEEKLDLETNYVYGLLIDNDQKVSYDIAKRIAGEVIDGIDNMDDETEWLAVKTVCEKYGYEI